MSEGIFFTREGYERLKKELKILKGVKRREIRDALEKARLLGDLSENSEYESAKLAQAITERKIFELEGRLAQAKLLDDANIPSDKAYVGAMLTLEDMATGEKIGYKLVTEDESDFDQGKISISSPVGKALLGKKKDEIVNIKVPAGILKYKVINISR